MFKFKLYVQSVFTRLKVEPNQIRNKRWRPLSQNFQNFFKNYLNRKTTEISELEQPTTRNPV